MWRASAGVIATRTMSVPLGWLSPPHTGAFDCSASEAVPVGRSWDWLAQPAARISPSNARGRSRRTVLISTPRAVRPARGCATMRALISDTPVTCFVLDTEGPSGALIRSGCDSDVGPLTSECPRSLCSARSPIRTLTRHACLWSSFRTARTMSSTGLGRAHGAAAAPCTSSSTSSAGCPGSLVPAAAFPTPERTGIPACGRPAMVPYLLGVPAAQVTSFDPAEQGT